MKFLVLLLFFSISAIAENSYFGGGGGVDCASGTNGQVYTTNGSTCSFTTVSGSGTVTSVGLTAPAWLTVTGSPVTASGTLAITGTSETANYFLAAPNGSSGAMIPRAIVAADVPTLNQDTTGTAANVTATSNSTLATLSALTTASSLVTVGTIGTGTWQGTGIAVGYGGTGTTTSTGTGSVVLSTSPTFLTSSLFSDGTNSYNMAPGWPGSAVTCTTSGTVNFNSQGFATVQVTLTSSDACSLTVSNVVAGGAYVIKILNATGATLSISKCDWGAAGTPTLSTSGVYDDIHVLVQQSTSSNYHCYISQGFSE